MKDKNKEERTDVLVKDLRERAKELNCLYEINDLFSKTNLSLEKIFENIVEILPSGWQFPDICQAQIVYKGDQFKTSGFKLTPWSLQADIKVKGVVNGTITVEYTKEVPATENGFFLKEEIKLINTIAERISHTIFHRELDQILSAQKKYKHDSNGKESKKWEVVLDLLLHSDKNLFITIAQKMLYFLCCQGIKEAGHFHQQFNLNPQPGDTDSDEYKNKPTEKQNLTQLLLLSEEIFNIASTNLNDDIILSNIWKWFNEDRAKSFTKVINNPDSSLSDVVDSITRLHHLQREDFKLSPAMEKGIRVSLIRRFFSDQLDFIKIAKNYIEVEDFYNLVRKIIFPQGSHGKLGGKSSGLFLAEQIIKKDKNLAEKYTHIKIPQTWYITSDGLSNFIHYNNLESVMEQKYKNVEEINAEYPNIIQLFKNSPFPLEILKGLSRILDDLGRKPIIVRSSSLLEDRLGSAFSGKYKSFFLANQGTSDQRLDALTDAIAEIYASLYAPDPIEYRKVRGLLDFFEEMGIMIQEVVGTKVGHYFFPSFAGVAFSRNEFRWSPKIKQEDGLIRLVPGLGTRAVDRVADDYPILLAPGKPEYSVNATPEEKYRYSTKKIDLINLKNNCFETIPISDLLKRHGHDIPGIHHIISRWETGFVQQPISSFGIDFETDETVVTFEGLSSSTEFVDQVRDLLKLLESKMNFPVDVEFAHDGSHFFLLQCRAQSYSPDIQPVPIPRNLPEEKMLFSANRYISNGSVPDITHVVYVDPQAYSNISGLSELKRVGRAIGQLNKILPKRQFILMGPGRWGSRGDIKLGVNVTYVDINNTAVLIEIAKSKGSYTPEPSFGTHFFQDLVEDSIRYLPLYPDSEGVIFNENFFSREENILSQLLPEYSDLEDCIFVIDIPRVTDGMVARILLNGDLDEAVAFIADPSTKIPPTFKRSEVIDYQPTDYWRWRLYMVEKMANQIDPNRFGVMGLYLFGSTKNATAGPGSDIDIIIHYDGSKDHKRDLSLWLEGWSLTFSELNFLRTGYKTDGLLDIHWVTDKSFKEKNSFASKIGAVTDAARPLKMKEIEK